MFSTFHLIQTIKQPYAHSIRSNSAPSIQGVSVGSSKEAVIRALGTPKSESPYEYNHAVANDGDMVILRYPGLLVWMINGSDRRGPFRVTKFEVFSRKWIISPGVHVGMPFQTAIKVLSIYKEVDARTLDGEKMWRFAFPISGKPDVGLIFLQNKKGFVSRIDFINTLD